MSLKAVLGASASPESFTLIPATKFASVEEQSWIISNILPKGELAEIYGEPGCGKTFLALEMAFCISLGKDFQRQRVKQGRVVYICAEGQYGLKKRLFAYLMKHNILDQEIPFDIVAASPDFMQETDPAALGSSIDNAQLIIIDTLASVMPGGNENKGEDVGFLIHQCRQLHQKTGALILLIHHSGKDSERGARGWSGLRGALDTEIAVSKVGSSHKAKITKQKDGDDNFEWGFDLCVTELGTNEDGDQITTCIYEASDGVPLEEKYKSEPKPTGRNQHKAMEMFAQYQMNNQLPFDEFVKLLAREMPNDGQTKDFQLRGNAKRTILALIDKGILDLNDNCVHKV